MVGEFSYSKLIINYKRKYGWFFIPETLVQILKLGHLFILIIKFYRFNDKIDLMT